MLFLRVSSQREHSGVHTKAEASTGCSDQPSERCILQQVFSFLPGHYLFIGAVCREWQGLYVGTADRHFEVHSLWDTLKSKTCDFKTTLCSAAVASPTTTTLACECGLQVHDKAKLQWTAGLHADSQTLATLRELGMPLSSDVIQGVAKSARLDVLQHLLLDQQCPRPHDISRYAARSGSISMLKWLHAEGWCVSDENTCTGAAQGGQLEALKYLRSIGCKWTEQSIPLYAAASGSIEVVEWLPQQEGIVIHARVLAAAAACNHIGMCQYLCGIGCEFTHTACKQAAAHGHMSTLHWLRESGCQWRVRDVCVDAARNGHTDVLDYVIEQGEVLEAELLTDALQIAGANNQLQAAQWLRQHGAEWPTVLSHGIEPDIRQWSGDTLLWARAQGCISPILDPDDGNGVDIDGNGGNEEE
jgi:hypothetical protein